MPAEPRRWPPVELAELAAEGVARFRAQRKDEPRQVYIEFFERFVPIFRPLIEQSLPVVADTLTEVDRALLAEIVSDPN